MKLKVFLASLLLFPFLSIAATQAAKMSQDVPKSDSTTMTKSTQTRNQDAVTVAFIIALDKNEIAAAKLAMRKKGIDPNVMNYAKMMIAAHAQHLKNTVVLARQLGLKPRETAAVVDLRVKGTRFLSQLRSLQGKDFDKTYIAGMVRGHMDALTLVNQLAKNTSNMNLKNYLMQTNAVIKAHLQEAKKIQNQLKKMS